MQSKRLTSSLFVSSTTAAIIVIFQLACWSNVVSSHTRLECPPSRSKETGAKFGPCDAPDDLSLPPYPLHPGFNTITWLESLGHPGAPARFALSLEGVDDGFESCVLLDHVPHDERSSPDFGDPLTFHRSSITLFLPDIYCERCHLQLITFMTDEYHGVPVDEECAYKGAQMAGTVDGDMLDCKVVYHSCAPISIDGTIPRDEYQCSLEEFERELGWPFVENRPPSSIYYYRGDPGIYDRDMSTLQSGGSLVEGCSGLFYCDPDEFYQMTQIVPVGAKYATPHGTCAAMTDMKVEPFTLGKLPSVPKVELSSEESDMNIDNMNNNDGNTMDSIDMNNNDQNGMENIETSNNVGNTMDGQADEMNIKDPNEDLSMEGKEVNSMSTSGSPSWKQKHFYATVENILSLSVFSLLVGSILL